MPRGGARPGAGRKKNGGAKGNRTHLKLETDDKEVLPLEVLVRRMRHAYKEGQYDKACQLAEKACPYMHPRLATVQSEHKGTLIVRVMRFGDDEYRDEQPSLPLPRLAS